MPSRKGMTYLKSSCSGCKAFDLRTCQCTLMFKIEKKQLPISNFPTSIIFGGEYCPLELCPKPRTTRKLKEALAARLSYNKKDPPYGTPKP